MIGIDLGDDVKGTCPTGDVDAAPRVVVVDPIDCIFFKLFKFRLPLCDVHVTPKKGNGVCLPFLGNRRTTV